MSNRHLSRSIALQALFEWDFCASLEGAVEDAKKKSAKAGAKKTAKKVELMPAKKRTGEDINEIIKNFKRKLNVKKY